MSEAMTHEVGSDPEEFLRFAAEKGWGDGLPLVPPTAERVERHVAASGLDKQIVVAELPPLNGKCTVERIAINAVMAGAPAEAMPLLIAAVHAVAAPEFDLLAVNATTASVVPALIVNGPQRRALGIGYGAGCLGGAESSGPAIGRALRLLMRNVAGHRVGVTSQSVFGQPGRVSGIVFAEWEERSPWAPLAERRGVPGDAVTAFAAMGTMNIVDTHADSADMLLDLIGRSLAYPGANGFLTGFRFSEVFVGINPVWAEIIGAAYSDPEAAAEVIWDAAALPLSSWPEKYHAPLTDAGRVDGNGRVHLMKDRPGRVLLAVCGGLGVLPTEVEYDTRSMILL